MPPSPRNLDPEELSFFFQEEGPLAQNHPSFEKRPSQLQLVEKIVETFNENKVAFFEAGTGVGKTLSYLLPSIIWASQNQEKVLISTHTITLQEQLLEKDLPFIQKYLGMSCKVSLLKGMNNYLCLRKLQELEEESLFFSQKELQEFESIKTWAENTEEGSLSSLPHSPSKELWKQLCMEKETCNQHHCPFFKRCFFFKERKESQNAHILLANHHLFFSDFFYQISQEKDSQLFSSCSKVVFDEAHHLEETAIHHLSYALSYKELSRLLTPISPERKGEMGLLEEIYTNLPFSLKEENPNFLKEFKGLISLFLPGLCQEALEMAKEFFEGLFSLLPPVKEGEELKYRHRLNTSFFTSMQWKEELFPLAERLAKLLEEYSLACEQLSDQIKQRLCEESLIEGKLLKLQGLLSRLLSFKKQLEMLKEPEDSQVCWIEEGPSLHLCHLDISNYLKECLYPQFSSLIFLSATLSTGGSFDFIKKNLGVSPELELSRVVEGHYPSSFDYEKQAMMLCPTDLPYPHSPRFISESKPFILQALDSCPGGAFILFTSYTMLQAFAREIEGELQGRELFVQGRASRKHLLEEFKNSSRGVLIGTSSFWEGVDVCGDKLQLVVITKLPFDVPTDPLLQARGERLQKEGLSGFMHDSLPRAIVKFKQGFGRLIRSKKDRGAVMCLDRRLIEKSYGKLFINSLPPVQVIKANREGIIEEMGLFFEKTGV